MESTLSMYINVWNWNNFTYIQLFAPVWRKKISKNKSKILAIAKLFALHTNTIRDTYGTKYSRMDQVKFVEDSLSNFLKAFFRKFYLVHSWIFCPVHRCTVKAMYWNKSNANKGIHLRKTVRNEIVPQTLVLNERWFHYHGRQLLCEILGNYFCGAGCNNFLFSMQKYHLRGYAIYIFKHLNCDCLNIFVRMETNPFFSNSSSYDEDLSQYIRRSRPSCKVVIRLSFPRLSNIHIRGQWLISSLQDPYTELLCQMVQDYY